MWHGWKECCMPWYWLVLNMYWKKISRNLNWNWTESNCNEDISNKVETSQLSSFKLCTGNYCNWASAKSLAEIQMNSLLLKQTNYLWTCLHFISINNHQTSYHLQLLQTHSMVQFLIVWINFVEVEHNKKSLDYRPLMNVVNQCEITHHWCQWVSRYLQYTLVHVNKGVEVEHI